MEIVYEEKYLEEYFQNSKSIWTSRHVPEDNPILLDRFLEKAKEIDVDLIRDKENNIYICGIMEHIEEAGIHSGDSACVIPAYELPSNARETIKIYTRELALKLNTIGLINIQFAMKNDIVYVIEVNPRASRTVPFVSKAIGIPLAKIAAKVMAGEKLVDLGFTEEIIPDHYSVKEAVFPFVKFPGIDIVLGPEMKATGEVMGIDPDLGMAYAKSQMAASAALPLEGNLFISVKDLDKPMAVDIAREYYLSMVIDRAGVAVRAGTHCAQPLLKRFGATSTCRASFGLYNTRAEVDALVDALDNARAFFG